MNKEPCSSECQCESQEVHDLAQKKVEKEFKVEYDNRDKILITPLQLNYISNVEMDILSGGHDYWCDAYIISSIIKCDSNHPDAYENHDESGYHRELTEDELDFIQNNYPDWIYNQIEKIVY